MSDKPPILNYETPPRRNRATALIAILILLAVIAAKKWWTEYHQPREVFYGPPGSYIIIDKQAH